MTAQQIKVSIADDHKIFRDGIKMALKDREYLKILWEAEDGRDLMHKLKLKQPDVLLMDIRMPDLSGMEAVAALRQVPNPPRIIFVTGYAEHAAEAFEKAAFDYVMKPLSQERIATTLSRLRLALADASRISAPSEPADDTPPSADRLPVRTDYAMRLLRIDDIECAVARQKRVYVRTDAEELKTTYTLTQLEDLLPHEKFFRVHASVIVQIGRIEQINFLGNHTYSARLTSGAVVPIGRSQYPELQRLVGI